MLNSEGGHADDTRRPEMGRNLARAGWNVTPSEDDDAGGGGRGVTPVSCEAETQQHS